MKNYLKLISLLGLLFSQPALASGYEFHDVHVNNHSSHYFILGQNTSGEGCYFGSFYRQSIAPGSSFLLRHDSAGQLYGHCVSTFFIIGDLEKEKQPAIGKFEISLAFSNSENLKRYPDFTCALLNFKDRYFCYKVLKTPLFPDVYFNVTNDFNSIDIYKNN